MTSRAKPPARRVAAVAVALFLAVLALLTFQLRSGRDPALGRGVAATAPAPPPPRRVLVRKIVITRIVVHLPAEDASRHPPAPVTAAAPVQTAPAAPASPVPVPAPVAPAPAPVAPAPAPVITRSS